MGYVRSFEPIEHHRRPAGMPTAIAFRPPFLEDAILDDGSVLRIEAEHATCQLRFSTPWNPACFS
jgi:hypothetical protein